MLHSSKHILMPVGRVAAIMVHFLTLNSDFILFWINGFMRIANHCILFYTPSQRFQE